MSSVTLIKALAEAGIGARRYLAQAIQKGRVEVNGVVVEDLRFPVNVEMDSLCVNGRPVDIRPKQSVCLMINKPPGVVSTTSDERGRKTVIDLLPEKYRRMGLYPAGRLDKNSSGLLLLTNDGELTYRLTHPKFMHEKEYLVSIDAKLRLGEKRKLEHGLELEDGMTSPAVVREVEAFPFNYSITVHEGRKRQVRRMFACIGYRVKYLKRIRIGSLELGDLREGDLHVLSCEEMQTLMGDRLDAANSASFCGRVID